MCPVVTDMAGRVMEAALTPKLRKKVRGSLTNSGVVDAAGPLVGLGLAPNTGSNVAEGALAGAHWWGQEDLVISRDSTVIPQLCSNRGVL